jgi:hypothetical protein
MGNVWNWILARLSEPSSWAGIAAGAAAVSSSLQSNTGLAASVLSGILAVVVAEKKTGG